MLDEMRNMLAPSTFYEVASDRLDEQLRRVDGLDAKAASSLAFSAAILPVFGAILALSKAHRPETAIVLYVIAMIVYCALLIFVALAYRVTKWSLRPDLPPRPLIISLLGFGGFPCNKKWRFAGKL